MICNISEERSDFNCWEITSKTKTFLSNPTAFNLFFVTLDLLICFLACVFYFFILHLQSGGFFSHICLSWGCYYLQGNLSSCLIQPSNHLLRVVSRVFLNYKQNCTAYSAHCFSSGISWHHLSSLTVTQSVRRQLEIWMKEQHEKWMSVVCYVSAVHPSDSLRMWIWRTPPDTYRLLYLLKVL